MSGGVGVNLRVTGHCSQGGRKYMEDMFSVAYQQTCNLKDLEYAFFGIFDGHGGPQAAKFAKEHLLDAIVNQSYFWSNNDEDVLRAIRDGYIATHYAMWKDLEKWPKTTTGLPSTSGCTATVAFIKKGKIYIGHVGDTAIVLGYQEDEQREWKAKVLTRDHKPESKEEKQRIEQSGGKVVNKSGVPRVVWNRPRLGHQGPVRRSTPIDGIPFLAVARSLGDFWSYNAALDQFVVSPEPDVFMYPVDTSKFRCLVLGTDGLWNMMTPERAVAIVQATESHNEKQVLYGLNSNSQYNQNWINPSKTLVDKALERWATTKLRADNTSVVTLLLDPPGPPRAQVLLKQMNNLRGENTALDEIRQMNSSRDENTALGEEPKFSVPKSGAMAIFTHFESAKDYPPPSPWRPVKIEMEKRDGVRVNSYYSSPQNDKMQKEGDPPLEEKKFGGEGTSSGERPHSPIYLQSRSEEKEENCVDDGSSDAENKRVSPNCELKKRRLSLDKKSSKPGVRRRPSLPALNGKTIGLCKSRSLEESTRMLRSATPIKTLRSRNIDLSDLSPSSGTKRNRALSPPPGKKQRLDEQRPKSANKSTESESDFYKSYLRPGEDAEHLFDKGSVKRDLQDVTFSKKILKERKHKSVPPRMWRESEEVVARSQSDSEVNPALSSISRRLRLPESKRQSRIRDNSTKPHQK